MGREEAETGDTDETTTIDQTAPTETIPAAIFGFYYAIRLE